MKTKFPIYLKIFLWLFLNILFIGLIIYLLFGSRIHTGIEALFAKQTYERLKAISGVMTEELLEKPADKWNNILKRFGDAYKLQLYIFRCNGVQVSGDKIDLPAEVKTKLASIRGRGMMFGRGPPPGRGFHSEHIEGTLTDFPHFIVRAGEPTIFWAAIRLPINDSEHPGGGGLALVVKFNSLFGDGALVDIKPVITVALLSLVLTFLFWLPFVRNLTRSIRNITDATCKISEGNFDVRLQEKRRDELGVLSAAINRLASRLEGFVKGQKRFLGDIAHELCAPIARIELALSIIEQRCDESQKAQLKDLREEVTQISGLVHELLSFSKIGLQEQKIKLEAVNLRAVVEKAVDREVANSSQIEISVPDGLTAIAEPNLLLRAISNIIRNAVRYAGAYGKIMITASKDGQTVFLAVEDNGPGVPEDELDKIFDPFYRIEQSRNRDYGGAGLGLAIVKTCITVCGGEVTAKNRTPSGLSVQVRLKAVE